MVRPPFRRLRELNPVGLTCSLVMARCTALDIRAVDMGLVDTGKGVCKGCMRKGHVVHGQRQWAKPWGCGWGDARPSSSAIWVVVFSSNVYGKIVRVRRVKPRVQVACSDATELLSAHCEDGADDKYEGVSENRDLGARQEKGVTHVGDVDRKHSACRYGEAPAEASVDETYVCHGDHGRDGVSHVMMEDGTDVCANGGC
eukprot:3939353-Rhodomonas_salina.6